MFEPLNVVLWNMENLDLNVRIQTCCLTTAFNPRLQDANALPKDGEVQELLASTDAKWVECIDGRQLKWGEHLGF